MHSFRLDDQRNLSRWTSSRWLLVQTLEDFERNFEWEYAHRLLGQTSALAVSGPLAYFFYKNKLPPATQGPLLLLLALGVTQMYVGRQMVRSNLTEGGHELEVKDPERESVATLALPAHVSLQSAGYLVLVLLMMIS